MVAGENEREKFSPIEIERKWLIGGISEIPEGIINLEYREELVQGYIVVTDDGTEVRLRRGHYDEVRFKRGYYDKFYLTVKMGQGKTRTELEIEITEDQFNRLWPATEGRRVKKTRYEIAHQHWFIEVDVYHGELEGLITAEVEFQNEEDSLDFVSPSWFGREVTEENDYKNQSLAHGLPRTS